MGIRKIPLAMPIQTLFQSYWKKDGGKQHKTKKKENKTKQNKITGTNNGVFEGWFLEGSRGVSNSNKLKISIRGDSLLLYEFYMLLFNKNLHFFY